MTADPFHPETIARDRAHAAATRGRGGCARAAERTAAGRRRTACTCTPDPVLLAELWAGRARMAAARRAGGVALDALDHEALARLDTSAGETAA